MSLCHTVNIYMYAYVKAIDMYVHRTAKLEYNEPEHSEFTAL